MSTFSQFKRFEALPIVETKYFPNPCWGEKISEVWYQASIDDIQEIIAIANQLDGHRPPQQQFPHEIKYFHGDKLKYVTWGYNRGTLKIVGGEYDRVFKIPLGYHFAFNYLGKIEHKQFYGQQKFSIQILEDGNLVDSAHKINALSIQDFWLYFSGKYHLGFDRYSLPETIDHENKTVYQSLFCKDGFEYRLIQHDL